MRPWTRREALELAGAGALVACGAIGLVGCGSSQPSQASPTTGEVDDPQAVSSAAATTAPETPTAPAQSAAQAMLESMTTEQKVAQLFFVTPEQLTGADRATVAGSMTEAALAELPVGGIAYFSRNIVGNQQLRDFLSGTHDLSAASGAGVPAFLGVDEEGGTLVARVARSGYFDVKTFPNMASIGATGDVSQATDVGRTIGAYLSDIGFSLDFAPDADVLTNPDNTAIGRRSFGSDAEVVAEMVSAEVTAMLTTGTVPCAKHFPGHGDTAGDSHTGAAISERTTAELEACEYKPFQAAIQAGCPLVMVGHIQTPNAAADDLPASMSPKMIGDVLRGQLGFSGVVISDSFSMGAITQYYDAATAATSFIAAGGDMILMPADLDAAYQGVLSAVQGGSIMMDRLDQSVGRILAAKQTAGLI